MLLKLILLMVMLIEPEPNYPIHLTNYTPFLMQDGEPVYDEDGNLVFHDETNFQCMHPCNMTGNGTVITPELFGRAGACINDWIGKTVYIEGYGEIQCIDSFGNPNYQVPFYHSNKGLVVYPVDILSPHPTYDTVYEWELRE